MISIKELALYRRPKNIVEQVRLSGEKVRVAAPHSLIYTITSTLQVYKNKYFTNKTQARIF